jgi:murein DD-endopeptidase MepM/ murein hydrolase activator NlpD
VGNKKFARVVAVILAVLMFLSVAMIAISALTGMSASARVTQAQIDKLREEKREIGREKREIQTIINSIEFERKEEIAKKQVLDNRITLTGLEIDSMNEIINQYNLLIREKEYEVVIAQNREEAQLQKFRTRVRDMEENGIISYIELIFDSVSFSDLLARLDFIGDIMRADESMYAALQRTRFDTAQAKAELEETREELEAEKLILEEMEAELQEQLEEAHALILQMEADIDSAMELRAQAIAEEDRVQKEINAASEELRRQQREERERLARERANRQPVSTPTNWVTGTGELMWPTSGPVTSAYGTRRHPVFGDMRFHGGIDIGAPHGQNVFASDSGTVITSTYNSNYGNYVVIDHGNGMTTLYAHLSSRSVSNGVSVTRGQVIGLIGSTGISTGPHLHFEVSVGGSRVNPMTRLG